MTTETTYSPKVLSALEEWVRSKGGKVQARLISDFYHKFGAEAKTQLHGNLYGLADCEHSKVHVVQGTLGGSALEFLELKQRGSRPLRQPIGKQDSQTNAPTASLIKDGAQPQRSSVLPTFTTFDGIEYALVRDPAAARAQLQAWAPIEPFAFDFKGDIRKDGRIALIQVSNRNKQVLMIDLVDNPRMPEESGLKEYFQNADKVKVILDCARPVEALRWIWGIEVNNVFDLSRSYIIVKTGEAAAPGEQGASLVMMVNELRLPFVRVSKPEDSWFRRPLSALQIEYSIRGVFQNMVIYDKIVERAAARGLMDACIYESARHALYMRSGGEDRENEDWVCQECNFENFRRRYACMKCEAPKPAVALPKQRSSAPVKGKPAPVPSRGASEEELAKKEEEDLRRALEQSIIEEQARLERSMQEQISMFEKPSPSKPQPSSSIKAKNSSSNGASHTATTNRRVVAAESEAPKPFVAVREDEYPQMPSIPGYPTEMPSQLLPEPSSTAFALPSLGVNLSPFYSTAATGLYGEPAVPSSSSSMALPGGYERGPFLMSGFPPPGLGLSPTLSNPPAVSPGLGGRPDDYRMAPSSAPAAMGGDSSKPPGLSDDEFLLLTLDATALIESLQMDSSLVDVIVQCAAKVGAKCELVEAPLPMFAKAMEQTGFNVNQRAMILKELHAKKNRQGAKSVM